MKNIWIGLFVLALLLPAAALAHFMVLQPSANIVIERDNEIVTVDMRFAHPFEQSLMDNDTPTQFGVMVAGKKHDLLPVVKTIKTNGMRTYRATYKIAQPGDHVFYVAPAPYYEPAEEKFIVHYTKTVVHGFGLQEGWDELVGLKTEIKPLTRPYGLWAGNVFQGQVLLEGKPVPHAEVEVGYDNKNGVTSPAEVFNIQVVHADQNGVFTYAMPRAGWWGFAALSEDENKKIGPDGKPKSIEIGAVIWVCANEMK
ncbi:MAG: DUF4198 domain-containing protein [Candidatus Lernaella stagnicola]|nr:DUF4198 domain-containing protein [Candidatus Lernaella stagnicola]